MKILIAALCGLLPSAFGHCDNQEPRGTASSFRFEDASSPDYDGSDGEPVYDYDVTYFDSEKVFQDDDNFAGGFKDCTHIGTSGDPNPFYEEDVLNSFPLNLTFDENGDGTDEEIAVTCKEALSYRRNNHQDALDAIEQKISDEFPDADVEIPNDPDICCETNFRFRQGNDLGPIDYKLSDDVTMKVTLNIEEELGAADATRFAELCEELFICSHYIQKSNRLQCIALGGKEKRCPKYEERSLCFDDFYKPYDNDERKFRLYFIAQACWGLGEDGEFGEDGSDTVRNPVLSNSTRPDELNDTATNGEVILYLLEENVKATCNAASERSKEALFEPTQECKELIECYKGQFPDDVDDEVKDGLEDQAYEICGDKTNAELDEQLEECTVVSTLQRPEYIFTEMCPDYLKGHFTPFPPDYPDDEDDEPNYRRLILDALGAEYNDRSNSMDLGGLKILRTTLASLVVATKGLRDAFPEDWQYVWKNLAWIVFSNGLLAVDAFIDRHNFHNGNIGEAEIEAMYENTRQLLDGSAVVFDQVRCRKTDSFPNDPKWGQGCDSIDNDCNYVVDECEEDKIPPIIDSSVISATCSDTWFANDADAKSCIDGAVSAMDDCDPVVNVASTKVPGSVCSDTTFNVTAMSQRCGQESFALIKANVDKVAPSVDCNLGGQKDVVLDSIGSNFLEDLGLTYSISTATDGDCTNNINATVKVFANELEDFQNQKMAVLYQTKGSTDGNVGLYVAKGLCETANNGQCIRDPDVKKKARLYTVKVTAVDEAGNASEDECRALIGKGIGFPDVAVSKQRFLLAQYSQVISG